MKRRHSQSNALALTFALMMVMLSAQGAIFEQTEPVSGVTILSNIPPRAEATTGTSGSVKPRAPSAAPMAALAGSGFPRITREIQQRRDAGRGAILRDELEAEQQALQAALARRAATEVLHRHSSNIAALKRELGGLH